MRGGVYADDPQVLAEVDFLGILPLADGERVVVSLVRGDGTVVREKAVESIPDACRGEFAFDMTGQPAGDYALTAAVRGQGGQPRAAASHVFAWPVSYAAKAPAPQTVVVPPLPAPRQRLQPQATVLPGGGIRVAVAGRQDRSQSKLESGTRPGRVFTIRYPRSGCNASIAEEGSWRRSRRTTEKSQPMTAPRHTTVRLVNSD